MSGPRPLAERACVAAVHSARNRTSIWPFCHWSAEEVTLHLVAPQQSQELALLLGLDSLGHDLEVRAVAAKRAS